MVSVQANDNTLCEGGYPYSLCEEDQYNVFRIIMLITWFTVTVLTVVIAFVLFRNYLFHWWTPKKLIFLFAFFFSFDRFLGFLFGVAGVKSLVLFEVIFAFGQCFSFSSYSILVVVWSELYTRAKNMDHSNTWESKKLRRVFLFINAFVYLLLIFSRLFQYVIPVHKAAKNLLPVLAFLVVVGVSIVVVVQGFRLLRQLRKIREITIKEQKRLTQMTFLIVNVALLSIALPVIFLLARLAAQKEIFWLYLFRCTELFAWAIIGIGLFNEQSKHPKISMSGSPIELPGSARAFSKSESLSVLPSPTDSYAEVVTPFDSIQTNSQQYSLQYSSSTNTV